MTSAGIKRSPSPSDLRERHKHPNTGVDQDTTNGRSEALPPVREGSTRREALEKAPFLTFRASSLPEQSSKGNNIVNHAQDTKASPRAISQEDTHKIKTEDGNINVEPGLDGGNTQYGSLQDIKMLSLDSCTAAEPVLDLWPRALRQGGSSKSQISSLQAPEPLTDCVHAQWTSAEMQERQDTYITRCKYLSIRVCDGEKALESLGNELLRLRQAVSDREKLLELDKKLLDNQEQCAKALLQRIKANSSEGKA